MSSEKLRLVLISLLVGFTPVPATAWNPPAGDDCRATPGPLEEIRLEPDGWSSYLEKGHAFLTQRAIAILAEDRKTIGGQNVADLLAPRLEALLSGARCADHSGRGVEAYVTICVPNPLTYWPYKCWKVWPLYSIANEASFEHYYNPDAGGPGGLDLKDESALEMFTQWTPWLPGGDELASLAGSLAGLPPGIVTIRAETEPDLKKSYKPAWQVAQEHYDMALHIYEQDVVRGPFPDSWSSALFHLGWAGHLVQDMGVVHHTKNTFLSGHQDHENDAELLFDHDRVHAANAGVYADAWSAKRYVIEAARTCSREHADGKQRRESFEIGFRLAERHTAGLFHRFLEDVGELPSPVEGSVRDATTGKPVSRAYVFYRSARAQQGRWSHRYRIRLKPGKSYDLRPAMPGFVYVDRQRNPGRPFRHFHRLSPDQSLKLDFAMMERPDSAAGSSSVSGRQDSGSGGQSVARDLRRRLLFATAQETTLAVRGAAELGLPESTDVEVVLALPYKREQPEPILYFDAFARHVQDWIARHLHEMEPRVGGVANLPAHRVRDLGSSGLERRHHQPRSDFRLPVDQRILDVPLVPAAEATPRAAEEPAAAKGTTAALPAVGPASRLSVVGPRVDIAAVPELTEQQRQLVGAFTKAMEQLAEHYPNMEKSTGTDGRQVKTVRVTRHPDASRFAGAGILPLPVTARSGVAVAVELVTGPGLVGAGCPPIVVHPRLFSSSERGVILTAGSESGTASLRFTIRSAGHQILDNLTRDVDLLIQPSLTEPDSFEPTCPRLSMLR